MPYNVLLGIILGLLLFALELHGFFRRLVGLVKKGRHR